MKKPSKPEDHSNYGREHEKPARSRPTKTKPNHKETHNHGHNEPSRELLERIEHLERRMDKRKKELEELKVKFDEAIQKITTAADGVAARVAVLEAGKGDLTPDQEAAVNNVTTKLDSTATGTTP